MMMRRRSTSKPLGAALAAAALAACVAAVAAWACVTAAAGSAGARAAGPPAGAARQADAGTAHDSKRVSERRLLLALSAAPDDLAVAEVRFEGRTRERISRASGRLGVIGPFGDDYLGAAVVEEGANAGRALLVVLVNRPSPLLDPVSVTFALTVPQGLGKHALRGASDPFTRPASGVAPAVCALTRRSPIAARELASLRALGAPLGSFSPAEAAAQAYDAVCGLSYSQAFRRAVTGPPPPQPAPPPAPHPIPEPPHCPPCVPTPGYACPLATPSVCFATATARRGLSGAAAR